MNRGHLSSPRMRPAAAGASSRRRSWILKVAMGLSMSAAFFVALLLLDALPGFITPAQVQERTVAENLPEPPASAVTTQPSNRARLAIVIDDWGYPSPYSAEFLSMDIPLTAAVIPHETASQRHLEQAKAAGFDVLVHLPMEPGNAQLVTSGMITVDMETAEVSTLTREALRGLPGVVGVNNHMGSKATEDERVVQAVLEVMAEEGLLFLDSRTSSNSVAAAIATQLGVPTLENAVFLDGEADEEYIRGQLLYAARQAQRNGAAVAIGHLRPKTAQAIQKTLPELEQMEIELVRISELVAN
jgi:polysaccharide deacetylase 2 family uncharacterized protein YibQ